MLTPEILDGDLPNDVIAELREAKRILEHHGLADRLTELMGTPITGALKMLPGVAEDVLHAAIDKSLKNALNVAVKTLGNDTADGKPRLLRHKIMAGLSGAAGGAFGLPAVALELPVSTVVILRSVADIARSQGEDLRDIQTQLACLEVFAIDGGRPGGRYDAGRNTKTSDGSTGDATAEIERNEVGYFAVRAAMSKQVADASKYVIKHGLGDATAPPLVRLIATISSRFGVVVSEKLAAQAIPVIGAVGGALINSYFIDHYQDLARAHFTMRRLEREHGSELIREAFNGLT